MTRFSKFLPPDSDEGIARRRAHAEALANNQTFDDPQAVRHAVGCSIGIALFLAMLGLLRAFGFFLMWAIEQLSKSGISLWMRTTG
jgi:hypothetical protein